jgi:membrane dipeptidase
MFVIDGHCDVLSKLFLNPQLDFYKEEKELDVSYPRLQKGNVKVQFMAIYMPEKLQNPQFDHVLQFIDIFQQNILGRGDMAFIRSVQDFENVLAGNRIGAILSMEGVDALHGNLTSLRIAHYLGVRAVGITWNYANWAADGVLEQRKGGFTAKGRKLIKECNRLRMILDVSHLSEAGFWEVSELSETPFIASHSNVRELCPHPRNLNKEQIEAIIRKNGIIGITFVPWFVKSLSPVKPADLLKHIDYICSLGGVNQVAFGSDFDGIDQWIEGLENAGRYENIIEELCKQYKYEEVALFCHKNWHRFLREHLPGDEQNQSRYDMNSI